MVSYGPFRQGSVKFDKGCPDPCSCLFPTWCQPCPIPAAPPPPSSGAIHSGGPSSKEIRSTSCLLRVALYPRCERGLFFFEAAVMILRRWRGRSLIDVLIIQSAN